MSKPLRLVFMGTPDFAVPALRALHQDGHEIVAVYCQAPKPAGRGQEVRMTPVHCCVADELGVPVCTPKTLRDAEAQKALASFAPDAIIVAAYGLILSQAVLDIPKIGCINIHGSLLPRWRGAAPIHRAILAGDTKTGITIMKMEAGLDTGPMYAMEEIPITSTTTAQSLHDEMAALGARLIVQTLPSIADGRLKPQPQPEEGVTYAAKLTREDGVVDWGQSAFAIERQVRALNPWPGAFFSSGDEKIKILKADIVEARSAAPGTLLDDQMTIACGEGSLRLLEVQRAGKKPTDGASFLRGLRVAAGHVFK